MVDGLAVDAFAPRRQRCPRDLDDEDRDDRDDTRVAQQLLPLLRPGRGPPRAMARTGDPGERPRPPQGRDREHVVDLAACYAHLDDIVPVLKSALYDLGALAFEIRTTAPSDFITSAGRAGRYILPSRDLIVDDIEAVVEGARLDAMICLSSCDKTTPAHLMAAVRLDIPTIIVPCGYQHSGLAEGREADVEEVFLLAAKAAVTGEPTEALEELADDAILGPGVCAGFATANSMHVTAEALGMTVPGAAPVRANSERMWDIVRRSAETLVAAISADLRPRDIVTAGSIRNAARVMLAMGGSMNTIKHLQAIAVEAGVDIDVWETFRTLGRETPLLCAVRPNGPFLVEEVEDAGGGATVLRELLPLLDGAQRTVNGMTLAEQLGAARPADGRVIRTLDDPFGTDPAITVLRGTLAPGGAVAKRPVPDPGPHRFTGPARVFTRRDDAIAAIADGRLQRGDVCVIRGIGVSGGPGMGLTSAFIFALHAKGLADDVALVTDGQFSGSSIRASRSARSPPRPPPTGRSGGCGTAMSSTSTSPRERSTCSWIPPSSPRASASCPRRTSIRRWLPRPIPGARAAARVRRRAVPAPERGGLRARDRGGSAMSAATVHLPARDVPVYGEYDVVVVGGGPAGIMAAAAAARAGRSTLLVERYGFLGGAGTMGGLSTFCGLHARVYGEDLRVIRGLADELLDRMAHLDALNPPHLSVADRIMAQAFDISSYKIALDELMVASGVEVLFHASAQEVVLADDTHIDGIVVASKSGTGVVRGRIIVDASGDADVAAWSGAPFERSEHLLYPSLMFRINGVHPEEAGEAWTTIRRLMEEAEEAGTHRFPRKKPIVRPQRNPLEWRSNLTQLSNEDGSAIDGTDVWQLTRGELQGRRQVQETFEFIRAVTPGFQDAYIVDIAPQIGIRETRRIVGAYQLTEDDVLGCADFDDSIGVNGWPVEAHVQGDVEFRFAPVDSRGYNQLPYRMLVPERIENLLVAGRCASMTQRGQSSGRVTGPCFAMGQAAGTAAHLALATGIAVGSVDPTALQNALEEAGAYLGGADARVEPAPVA